MKWHNQKADSVQRLQWSMVGSLTQQANYRGKRLKIYLSAIHSNRFFILINGSPITINNQGSYRYFNSIEQAKCAAELYTRDIK